MINKKDLKTSMSKDFEKQKNYNNIIKKVENKNPHQLYKHSYIIPLLLIMILLVHYLNPANNIQEEKAEDKTSSCNNQIKENKIIINEVNNKKNQSNKNITKNKVQIKRDDQFNNLLDYKFVQLEEAYAKDKDGEKVLNGYIYTYETKNKGKIIITISNIEEPLSDYSFDETLKKSTIKNTEVTIVNFEKTYVSTFKNNETYFNIETTNIDQKELIDLITYLLK